MTIAPGVAGFSTTLRVPVVAYAIAKTDSSTWDFNPTQATFGAVYAYGVASWAFDGGKCILNAMIVVGVVRAIPGSGAPAGAVEIGQPMPGIEDFDQALPGNRRGYVFIDALPCQTQNCPTSTVSQFLQQVFFDPANFGNGATQAWMNEYGPSTWTAPVFQVNCQCLNPLP